MSNDPVKKQVQLPVSGATITVGCKLPHGLKLEIGLPTDEGYAFVILAGANTSRVINGWGVTKVNRDFWNKWLSTHKNAPYIKSGAVFAHEDDSSVRDSCEVSPGPATGFERLDPSKALPVGVKPLSKDD